jgi:RNA polymerase sigma factor (sigma-70 family)
MATTRADLVLHQVRGLAEAEAPDTQLLERFSCGRDEAAFAALVKRHGPMVLGVCRRVLHDAHSAEDAFQATFLALSRKAGAAGSRGSVGGWLYRVAYRAALRARRRQYLCQAREAHRDPRQASDPLAEMTGRELLTVLDQELQKLAEPYRAPLVLCFLEGRSRDEAALELGCSQSTLRRRLEVAKERLRRRLERRGLALPAALLAMGLAAPAVPASLAAAVTRATACQFLRGVFMTAKARVLGTLLLAAGLLAAGAAALTPIRSEALQVPEPQKTPTGNPMPAKGDDKKRMSVTGQVLDPTGVPVGGAEVMVLGWPRGPARAAENQVRLTVLGRAKSDAGGDFRIDMPRTSSVDFWHVSAVARAPGFGLAIEEMLPDAQRPRVVLRLQREQVLHGRLVELQGAPAANLLVKVEGISVGGGWQHAPLGERAPWPAAVKTGPDGRFILRGLGPSTNVILGIDEGRFATGRLGVPADHPDRANEAVLTLDPARLLSGRVTYADTGKLAAGAHMLVMTSGNNFHTTTDAVGNYRIAVNLATAVHVYAAPAEGQPYLSLKKWEDWPKGAAVHHLDMALPRGLVVTGTVTEAPGGKPVSDADVQFFPQEVDNPEYRPDVACLWHSPALSGPDGRFSIVLPPGPAHLLVNARTPDFIYQRVSFSVLNAGQKNRGGYAAGPEGNAFFGNQQIYSHAIVPLSVRKETPTEPLRIGLCRGVTIRGRLLDAEGKPVAHATMLSRLQLDLWDHVVRSSAKVGDGRFELRGCDPMANYRVFFLDSAGKQGAVADIAGKQSGSEPLTIRLAPCGAITARLVSEAGEPFRKRQTMVSLVVTPGTSRGEPRDPMADEVSLAYAHNRHHTAEPQTDDKCWLTIRGLIPGATYRIQTQTGAKDFVAQPGKTMNIGDIADPVLFAEGS